MSNETKHINYSAADIEKYHGGELSPAAMHAMEKAALDDPFLADAMEGYEASGSQQPASLIQNDINDLQSRLAARVATEHKTVPVIKFSWWKVAAAVLLFIGAGWIYTSINNKSTQQNIAKTEDVKNEVPAPASASAKTGATKSAVKTDTVIVTNDLAITERKQPAKNINPVTSNYERSVPGRNKAINDSSSVAAAPAVADEKDAREKSAGNPKAESKKDLATSSGKPDTANSMQNRLRLEDNQASIVAADKKQRNATESNKKASGISSIDDKTFYSPSTGRANNLSNTFNGQIVDQSNKPVANVLVQIPNLNFATETNDKGYFSFKSKDTALKVSIASAGFETQNIELTTNSIDDESNVIRLKPSLINLNEVVVGYGTKKKENLTKTNNVTINIMDAEPSAGWNEYNQYLEKNKKIPGEVKDIHGEVIISFVVSDKGKLKNFHVEKSLIEQLDNEAVQLIKEGPSWKLLKGKKAKVSVTVKF